MSAFSASIFIWCVICWIARVLSQAIWLTSLVSRAISAEMSASLSGLSAFFASYAVDLAVFRSRAMAT
jgi:hypothetical protein